MGRGRVGHRRGRLSGRAGPAWSPTAGRGPAHAYAHIHDPNRASRGVGGRPTAAAAARQRRHPQSSAHRFHARASGPATGGGALLDEAHNPCRVGRGDGGPVGGQIGVGGCARHARAWPGARPPPFRPPRHPADANHRLTWGSRAWRAPLRRLGGRRMRCAGAALRGRARGVAAPRKRRLSPGSGEPVAGVGSSRAARRRPRPHHSRAGRPRRGRPWRRPPRTATTTPGWSWPWSRWAEEGGGGAARFARRP